MMTAERDPFYDVFDPKADSSLSTEELAAKKRRYDRFPANEEIPRISEHVFGERPKAFQRLGASANAIEHLIYLVTLPSPSGTDHILRINADSAPDMYLPIETLIYEKLRGEGIGAPSVSATQLRNAVFPYDFTVLEKIGTGTLEAHLKETPSDATMYAALAGEYLAHVNRLPLSGFGHFSFEEARQGRLVGLRKTWHEAIFTQLEETLGYLVGEQLVDATTAHCIGRTLQKHEHLTTLPKGVLLHGDYHDANILIDADRKEIVGAIDLSQAKVGDPVFDIAFHSTYHRPEWLVDFLTGYARGAALPEQLEDKLPFYRLRILLSKAKLRKRFNIGNIPAALEGIHESLERLA